MSRRIVSFVRRHAPTPSTDKLVLASLVVSVLLVGLAVATLWYTRVGTAADNAQARSDDLAACRAAFSAELVTGPTVAALRALAEHGGDSPQFLAAVKAADPERFVVLAEMSRTDPARFLRECHAGDPPS